MFSIHPPRIAVLLSALAVAGGAATITGVAQVSAAAPGFSCTDFSGGSSAARATVTAIRVAHHDGYDRLVIGFATSNAVPGFQLHRQASPTFTRDASGQPVALDGSAGIKLVLQNADIADGVPADVKAGLTQVREVANIGNFERVVSYGVGLHDQACLRVSQLTGPSRLVIDVATPPAAEAAASQPATAVTRSTTPIADSLPANLAATGHTASASGAGPASGAQPATIAIGLLALLAGIVLVGVRRLVR